MAHSTPRTCWFMASFPLFLNSFFHWHVLCCPCPRTQRNFFNVQRDRQNEEASPCGRRRDRSCSSGSCRASGEHDRQFQRYRELDFEMRSDRRTDRRRLHLYLVSGRASTATGGAFGVRCTNTLPYTMSLDATSGTVIGLAYTLGLSASSGTGAGLTGASYSVTGNMASGQSGDCATTAICSGTQARVLTVSY